MKEIQCGFVIYCDSHSKKQQEKSWMRCDAAWTCITLGKRRFLCCLLHAAMLWFRSKSRTEMLGYLAKARDELKWKWLMMILTQTNGNCARSLRYIARAADSSCIFLLYGCVLQGLGIIELTNFIGWNRYYFPSRLAFSPVMFCGEKVTN